MRLLYASDLHLEFGKATVPDLPSPNAYDLVILAGDVHRGARGCDWALSTFPGKDIIYVPGNHEHYGYDYNLSCAAMKAMEALDSRLRVLLRETVVIDGVRFVGATLWSECRLPGVQDAFMYDRYIERSISDFNVIKLSRGPYAPNRDWSVDDCRTTFNADKNFLDHELKHVHAGPTVVVTHFLPSRSCIAPKYENSPLNGYFASDCDDVIWSYKPDAWIYGHTHDASEQLHESGVRLYCNPFGYPNENAERSWKIIEV